MQNLLALSALTALAKTTRIVLIDGRGSFID